MKLAPILAQYLYANKRLDLPGIGSFSLENSNATEADNSPTSGEGIHFESNPYTKESPDLIAFISAQTGKMKALAAADLSSHIELVQQFLNIGKPFLLEGIGSLVKTAAGKFSFAGATVTTEKLKDHSSKEVAATSVTEESFSSYDPVTGKKSIKVDWRKPVMIVLALGGTALAIWGGYTIYKNKNAETQIAGTSNTETLAATVLIEDSSAFVKKNIEPVSPTATPRAGNYKFVLETANKTRALERYARLKTYEWAVQMETQDSVKFKLFMLLPAGDTTRVLDSLTALNGRRVYIEN